MRNSSTRNTHAWFTTLLFFVFCFQFIGASSTSGKSKQYTIRKEDSQVEFSVYKWKVIKEEGRFKDFSGTITFDADNPASLTAYIQATVGSVDSRNENRDGSLRSDQFFNAAKFPIMRFVSTGATPQADGTIAVTGDLTIRGVTKRITVPVKLAGLNAVGGQIGELVGFETTFVINRNDFGVGRGWDIISDDVTIHLLIGAGG